MAETLEVDVVWQSDVPVVRLRGEVDLATITKFEDALRSVISARPTLVVLDMRELEFLDVCGVRALLRVHSELARYGASLRLWGCRSLVRRLLAVLEVRHHFVCTDESGV